MLRMLIMLIPFFEHVLPTGEMLIMLTPGELWEGGPKIINIVNISPVLSTFLENA